MKQKKKGGPPPPPPEVPFYVTDMRARMEYARIMRALGGNLSPTDESLLADYCNTLAEIVDLTAAVAKEGKKLTGPKGGEYINPTLNILISRQSHLAALRRDLFFTPRSRGQKQQPKGKALTILDKLREAERTGPKES